MTRPIDTAFDAVRSGELLSQLRQRPGAWSFRSGPVAWSVYEDNHPHAGKSLIFESERIARRVRSYPANWCDLTDEQLATAVPRSPCATLRQCLTPVRRDGLVR